MRRGAWIIVAALSAWPALARAEMAAIPPGLVPLDSDEGEKRLVSSHARRDFFKLSETFVTQKEQSLCPVASGVMVLNALAIQAPASPAWAPYKTFTQDNFFNDRARELGVARGGLQLDQLKELLETYPVDATAVHASDTNVDAFRKTIASDLADPSNFIIVNFLRSGLDEDPKGPVDAKVAGHFSPIGAYDEATDSVLMLDVARYKYPPLWIPTAELFAAMNTVDVDSGKTRGYLLVRAGTDSVRAAVVDHPRSRLLTVLIVAPVTIFGFGMVLGSWLTRWRAQKKKKSAPSDAA